MNLTQRRAPHHPDVLSLSFNQQSTHFSVGGKDGFRLYQCHPFRQRYGVSVGGISVCEMLGSSSLLAVVGGGEHPAFSPRTLHLWNTATNTSLCAVPFDSVILSVKLNQKRLVVVLQKQISIFDLNTMSVLQSLETPRNPKGLVAFSPDPSACFVVFPKQTDAGELIVYDALSLTVKNVFLAHKTPVAALALSSSGALLATASDTGTVIRVFAMPRCQLVFTFRRGSKSATISSLAFSHDERFLVAAGSNPTIHIYKLERAETSPPEPSKAEQPAALAMIGGVLTSAMAIGRAIEGERDFARVRLRTSGDTCLCAITSHRRKRACVPDPTTARHADPSSSSARGGESNETGAAAGAGSGGAGAGSGIRAGSPSSATECGGGKKDDELEEVLYSVTVATSSGVVYQYALDAEKGGECKLQHEVVVVQAESEAIGTAVLA